jgi:hypothetical protein
MSSQSTPEEHAGRRRAMIRRQPGTADPQVTRIQAGPQAGVGGHVQHWVKALYNSAEGEPQLRSGNRSTG